jgi:hypothetical protein
MYSTSWMFVLKKYQNNQKEYPSCHQALKKYIQLRPLDKQHHTFDIFRRPPCILDKQVDYMCNKLYIIYRRQCKNLFVFIPTYGLVSSEVLRPSPCYLNILYSRIAMNNLQWMIGVGAGWWSGDGVSHPRKKPVSRGAGPQLTEAHIYRTILSKHENL